MEWHLLVHMSAQMDFIDWTFLLMEMLVLLDLVFMDNSLLSWYERMLLPFSDMFYRCTIASSL
jgi:hypothetical protein